MSKDYHRHYKLMEQLIKNDKNYKITNERQRAIIIYLNVDRGEGERGGMCGSTSNHVKQRDHFFFLFPHHFDA